MVPRSVVRNFTFMDNGLVVYTCPLCFIQLGGNPVRLELLVKTIEIHDMLTTEHNQVPEIRKPPLPVPVLKPQPRRRINQ